MLLISSTLGIMFYGPPHPSPSWQILGGLSRGDISNCGIPCCTSDTRFIPIKAHCAILLHSKDQSIVTSTCQSRNKLYLEVPNPAKLHMVLKRVKQQLLAKSTVSKKPSHRGLLIHSANGHLKRMQHKKGLWYSKNRCLNKKA